MNIIPNLGGKTYTSIWNHHLVAWQKPNFSESLIQSFSLSCLRFIQFRGNQYQSTVMDIGRRKMYVGELIRLVFKFSF